MSLEPGLVRGPTRSEPGSLARSGRSRSWGFDPVFQSLPEEERERVMTEEKMCGTRVGGGVASSPHRARSPSVKVPRPCLCWAASTLGHRWGCCGRQPQTAW